MGTLRESCFNDQLILFVLNDETGSVCARNFECIFNNDIFIIRSEIFTTLLHITHYGLRITVVIKINEKGDIKSRIASVRVTPDLHSKSYLLKGMWYIMCA